MRITPASGRELPYVHLWWKQANSCCESNTVGSLECVAFRDGRMPSCGSETVESANCGLADERMHLL